MVILSPFTFHLSPCLAQTSMLSIGVRGGGQTFLPTAAVGATGEVHAGIGAAGALDLRYTFYSNLADHFELGLTAGAGFGYGATGIKGTNTDNYSNTDYMGNTMDYTVNATYSLKERFAKVDLSLLLAARFGSFTVNVGPRMMLPFAATSSITISEASIDAYYPLYDVHVTDQLITGKLETPYAQTVTSSLPKYNVLMALELGYEWALDEKNSIGFQAFADIAVWSPKSPMTNDKSPMIQVSPITDSSNPVPAVTVNTPDNCIAGKRYIDFGIRAYYAFSIRSQRSPSRDTPKHHNRYRWY